MSTQTTAEELEEIRQYLLEMRISGIQHTQSLLNFVGICGHYLTQLDVGGDEKPIGLHIPWLLHPALDELLREYSRLCDVPLPAEGQTLQDIAANLIAVGVPGVKPVQHLLDEDSPARQGVHVPFESLDGLNAFCDEIKGYMIAGVIPDPTEEYMRNLHNKKEEDN